MKNFKITDLVHPKVAFFLAMVPFMLLCPLIISIIFTGYPLNSWANNIKVNKFSNVLSAIELPEEVSSAGEVRGYLGGFNNDEKNQCDLLSARVITSKESEEKLGGIITKNFSKVFNEKRVGSDELKLARTAQVFIIPVNSANEVYNNGSIRIDMSKLDNSELDLSDENKTYLLYMINYDVFESSDSRCSVST